MTTAEARRKYDSLRRLTVARSCTAHEAATAARLAAAIASKFGFEQPAAETNWRPDFDARFRRAETHASMRFAWEYRRCGKSNCHCARATSERHGPYKYAKRRAGKKVFSVYFGK